jgi:CelD/BcsL family acetyltransferase involved in cellulose biosynthesis
MRVECVSPLALEAQDVARWRDALAADAELTSPYLTPDWVQLVARHRGDVSVAVFRDDCGAVAGFLPVQLSGSHAAMPVGGPICDYQAFIGSAGVDLSLAVRELGVGRIDLTAGLANNAVSDCLLAHDAGHVVRFAGGWQDWCDQRVAAGSKTVARTRKRLAKLTRDHDGDVAIEAFSTDAQAFETLLSWKRAQMKRTGVTDIFEHAWIDRVVRDSFAWPAADPNFGGAMFVLRVKGAPAAVLFCLRAGRTLHAWFVAHDEALSAHSPGFILFVEAIRAAASAGYAEMDLGPGDYRFKESLANHARPIGAGFIGRPGLSAAYKAAQFQMRALVESLPVGPVREWPAKAMRRLDIARGLAAAADRAA